MARQRREPLARHDIPRRSSRGSSDLTSGSYPLAFLIDGSRKMRETGEVKSLVPVEDYVYEGDEYTLGTSTLQFYDVYSAQMHTAVLSIAYNDEQGDTPGISFGWTGYIYENGWDGYPYFLIRTLEPDDDRTSVIALEARASNRASVNIVGYGADYDGAAWPNVPWVGIYLGKTASHIKGSEDGQYIYTNAYAIYESPLYLRRYSSNTATIGYTLRLSHTTSATAAAHFGVGLEVELEDAAGNMQIASRLATLWATATSGAESPLFRGTNHPQGSAGPGYWGFWTWNDLDSTARTIVPNGTGDVTSGVIGMYRLSESGGGKDSNVIMVDNDASVILYNDGNDVCTLTVNSNGSVTVVRTDGSATFDISLFMVWL